MIRRVFLGLVLALTVLPAVSHAGALAVSPVGFDLPAGVHTAVLTVSNDGDAPISVQVRGFKWTQTDGADQLTPTPDIVVSPPFSNLPAHAQQIVRVVRLKAAPATEEESYRLIVDELPSAAKAGAAPMVKLLMRHSIPAFFGADAETGATATVAWRLDKTHGRPMLVATNTGARRLRVSDLTVRDATGGLIIEQKGLVGYVLSNAVAQWPCPLPSPNTPFPLRLKAQTDEGPLDATIASPAP
jgi:fimbrial chaperone protein